MSLKKWRIENFSVKVPKKKTKPKQSIDLVLPSKFIWAQTVIKVDVNDWSFAAAWKHFHLSVKCKKKEGRKSKQAGSDKLIRFPFQHQLLEGAKAGIAMVVICCS